MNKPIGVWVEIERNSGIWNAYCSLGQYVEDKGTDTFEVEDTDIHFYFDSEQHLKDSFLNKHTEEFDGVIKSYKLVYKEKDNE